MTPKHGCKLQKKEYDKNYISAVAVTSKRALLLLL
jgi:hypothetical protein